MKGIDKKWLTDKGLEEQKDGTYKKKRVTTERRVKEPKKEESNRDLFSSSEANDGSAEAGVSKIIQGIGEHSIEIRLFGEPMPKQSVRLGKYGAYQPKKYKVRTDDYQEQLRAQLPSDFKMFDKEVIIEEMIFIFKALKGFNKKQMKIINEGGFIPKLTRPDLPDNLKKLPLDSMSEIVFRDDSIIWQECNTRKVYGTGGCIIIKLKGI